MPTKGFEGEILNLMNKMKKRKERKESASVRRRNKDALLGLRES